MMRTTRLALLPALALLATACPGPETPPVLPDTTLGDTTVGIAVSRDLHATGGKAPLSYSAVGLPAGMMLDSSSGTLSGAPTTAGDYNIGVTVTDADAKADSKPYSFKVYPAPAFASATIPNAVVGSSYTATFVVNGGKPPLVYTALATDLPPELTFNASNGTLTGTPTSARSFSLTVQVEDANRAAAQQSFSAQITSPGQPPQITTTPLAAGIVGQPYSQMLAAAGGQGSLTWSATPGTLPPGVTLAANGALSGTPTQAGTYSASVTVTDSVGLSDTAVLTIEIRAVLAFVAGDPGDAYVGSGFNFLFNATGGLLPYSWFATAGLPPGLTFTTVGNAGSLSGTPTSAGTYAFTVMVSDASGQNATRSVQMTVYTPPAIANTAMADGSVGQSYSQSLVASGGKAPYTFSIASGALPAGLTLGPAAIAGSPSAAGSSTFTLQVSDANGQTATATFTIIIYAGLAISTGTLPMGYLGVGYSQTLAAVGGTPPYTWSVTGTLPPGIVLSGDVLVGTPTTSGTYSFSVTATDSAVPADSKTKALAIIIAPALAITTSSLPDGYVGVAYAGSVGATGGKAPYSYSATSLPGGVTLDTTGVLSGSPIAGGTYNAVVQVTDDNGTTASRTLAIVVYDPPSLAPTTFAEGTVGRPYSQAIPASGGKAPLAFSVSAGALPVGLSLSGGNIAGTPTAAGTSSFTLQVTDQGSRTATASYSITIHPVPQITTASLPDAYQGIAYTQTLAATGGLAPLTWSISSGALPSGMTMTGSTISGTPAAAGTSSFVVSVVDTNGATGSASLQILVVPPVSLTTSSLPDGYVSDSYSGALAASGGKAPYTFDIASGTLPSGLSLSAAGVLGGTATAAGTSTVTFRVTDANSTTATRSLSIAIYSYPSITTASYADGYRTEGYSQPTSATGGKPGGYTFSTASGALPAGLTLNTANGTISGTPTATGAATFTLAVADSNGKIGTRSFTITVYDLPSITTAGPLPDAYAGDSYSTTFAATGGKGPLIWSLSSGAPPPDLVLNPLGTLSGLVSASIADNQGHTFAVQVADANGRPATRGYTIRSYRYPELTTNSLTQATVGVIYRKAPATLEQLAAQYGKAPYTFSATGLPQGLALSASGAFSGIPAQGSAGIYTLAVLLTDSGGKTASRPITMAVVLPTPRPTGGWLSVAPEGSEITSVLTVFAIDKSARPLQGIGVRIRKNGFEYAPSKEALTGADGKAVFTGLDLNGTTDTVDVTANGRGFTNYSVTHLNATLVTMLMDEYPVPLPRIGAALVQDDWGGLPVLFGGSDIAPGAWYSAHTAWGCMDDLHRFDPGSGTWIEWLPPGMPSVPPSRIYPAAASAGNGITVLFGGLDCLSYGGFEWNDTWTYDSVYNYWTPMFPAQAPPARSEAAMFPGTDEVYLFGGLSGGTTYFNDLWKYSTLAETWTPISALSPPTRRSGMGFARRGNSLWVCGGWRTDAAGQNPTETGQCYAYDTTTNAWTTKPALPAPRHEFAMAYKADTDTLYVFGGLTGTVARNDMLRLGPGDTFWQVANADGDPASPPARAGHTLAYHYNTGQLAMFGGYDPQSASRYGVLFTDTWTYRSTTGAWTRRDVPRTPATYTLSGTIAGGYPTGSSVAYVLAVTSDGIRRDDVTSLSNGAGRYQLRDIPANSVVYVHALADAPAAAGLPANFYSASDLGAWGPITNDSTLNITLPGQVAPAVATGTYAGAADWASAYVSGTPRMKRPNLPGQRSGFFKSTAWGSYTLAFAGVSAPIVNTASLEAANNEPRGCDYTNAFFSGYGAGTLPLVQFPLGASGAAPGQNPCVPEGVGLAGPDAYAVSGGPRGVAAADFLGPDGAVDVAVASSTANTISLFRGDNVRGDFSFSSTVTTGITPSAVALANLIGDSNLDLVVVSTNSDTLGIYAGTGTGFLPLAGQNTYTSGVSSPIDVAVADVTNDGRLDIVVLNAPPGGVPGSIIVYKGDGTGSFTAAPATTLSGPTTALAIGKIDSDAIKDAAVTMMDTGGGSWVDVLRGTSSGTFQYVTYLLTPPRATSVAIGDIDGNGFGDIAVGFGEGSEAHYFLNSSGGWTLDVGVYLGGIAPQVALGNFNGDGYADLVVAYESAGYGAIARFLGDAGGFLSWDASAYADFFAQDIALVDANGDGKLDVVTTHDPPAGGSFQVVYSQQPLPVVDDPVFAVVAPPNSKIFTAYRGAYEQTWDWKYVAPVAAGPVTFSFPLPSQLAESRPAPSGQRAMWDPNFDLYSSAPAFNWDDSRYQSGRDGSNASQTYGYYRQ